MSGCPVTPLKFDFHGYHPRTLEENALVLNIIRQAWERGEKEIILVHGHGHGKVSHARLFANTNTGFLGLSIRGYLRHDRRLRQWMLSKIDVSHDGSTKVRLHQNQSPTRTAFDLSAFPDRDFAS